MGELPKDNQDMTEKKVITKIPNSDKNSNRKITYQIRKTKARTHTTKVK